MKSEYSLLRIFWVAIVFFSGGVCSGLGITCQASVVTTSSPLATHAAVETLRGGGNAADAACAAVMALGVSQSYFTGIGGGGFALTRISGKTAFHDFREQAPARFGAEHFLRRNGKPESSWTRQNTGAWAVGIPGTVAGCGRLVRESGKLPWAQVLAPAQRIAVNGFQISALYQEEVREQWERVSVFDFTKRIFGGHGGKGVKEGEVLKQPVLARTLEVLASDGPESFYGGQLAAGWLAAAQGQGVEIRPDDLTNYEVKTSAPIVFSFGNFRGVTAPAPSGAGLMVAGALRFLNYFQTKHGVPEPGSVKRYIQELVAAAEYGNLRDQNITDAAHSKMNPQQFLGSEMERSFWEKLEREVLAKQARAARRRTDHFKNGQAESVFAAGTLRALEANLSKSHTAHVNVIDDDGNIVALTSSVGAIFGSGITVPGYGFVLASTMGDFNTDPRNLNAPRPGARPRSNMSPTVIADQYGNSLASVGAAGGPLIPLAVVTFLQNYFVHGLSADAAMRHPRAITLDGKFVELDRTASARVRSGLIAAGYEVEEVEAIGSVLQAVVRRGDREPWVGVAETRYDGEAWAGQAK